MGSKALPAKGFPPQPSFLLNAAEGPAAELAKTSDLHRCCTAPRVRHLAAQCKFAKVQLCLCVCVCVLWSLCLS